MNQELILQLPLFQGHHALIDAQAALVIFSFVEDGIDGIDYWVLSSLSDPFLCLTPFGLFSKVLYTNEHPNTLSSLKYW